MLSAVIITKNEAHCIGRCINSLHDVTDEIIVVDSSSTDDTAAIAKQLGALVIQHPWLGFGPQKNTGIDAAANDWILSIDADECLDAELGDAIKAQKQNGMSGIYSVHFLHHYYGHPIHYGLENPQHKLRLFNRKQVRWNDKPIHESLILPADINITKLNGRMRHFGYSSLEQHAQKSNSYSTLGAQDLFARGKKNYKWKLWVSPVFTFFQAYFFKLGFLDGRLGFILAKWNAHTTWLKYAKLWQMWQQKKPQNT